jgi:uncharacterized protein YegP (UPF0339 family)
MNSRIAVGAFCLTEGVKNRRAVTLRVRRSIMTYEYWKDASGQWRWHLKAANGKLIANGGESFFNEKDCKDSIDLVKSSSGAPVKKIEK